MDNCIFCQIVAGKSPSFKVYEDGLFFGLLDINPASKGHTLLVPKKHYKWVHDVPEFGLYFETGLKIKKAMDMTLHPLWVQYLTHGLIPHAHIHIIPRYDSADHHYEGIVPRQGRLYFTQEEMTAIAHQIYDATKKLT